MFSLNRGLAALVDAFISQMSLSDDVSRYFNDLPASGVIPDLQLVVSHRVEKLCNSEANLTSSESA